MFVHDIRLIALTEDRRGLAAVEYALICLMMSTMLVVMWPTLQAGFAAAFAKIVTLIDASHS
jgi:Flp pilus assembly pilin Flp